MLQIIAFIVNISKYNKTDDTVGEDKFFLYPSEFLAETPIVKDEQEKNKQKSTNMCTSCIYDRWPGKKWATLWGGLEFGFKCHLNRERGGRPLGRVINF